MAKITKRACDLQPGDIVSSDTWRVEKGYRLVMLRRNGPLLESDGIRFGVLGETGGNVEDRYFGPADAVVVIESEALGVTPAQVDLLVETARMVLEFVPPPVPGTPAPPYSSGHPGAWLTFNRRVMLQKLVDRLSPIEPPTLAEALFLVAKMKEGVHASGEAERILTRARRAGVLK